MLNTETKLHEQQIVLPTSYQRLTLNWPELNPLFEAFKNRDYCTFMHSVAVHSTAQNLLRDLQLRAALSALHFQEIQNRSPFWMLHDIGKTAADIDQATAQQIVFPTHPDTRTQYQKARHWIHPHMSASVIKLWSNTTSEKTKHSAKKWAQLSYLHDNKLNPFLDDKHKIQLGASDKVALFLFSLSDTAMAMGLPRQNKENIHSADEIRSALLRKYLTDHVLKTLFPAQNTTELRNYILASVLDSVQKLQNQYPKEIWTTPPVPLNQEKTKPLDTIIIASWQECQQFWDATIANMDLANVFK